jgi:hypothetical protein
MISVKLIENENFTEIISLGVKPQGLTPREMISVKFSFSISFSISSLPTVPVAPRTIAFLILIRYNLVTGYAI